VRALADNITSDLIRSSLLYASEEMGIALRNSSYSPNIKERMDHSAAIFDYNGRLLAQAEHIPVHLGSLPWGLRNILDYCERERLELEEGCMISTNNPYIAGTHLNDITVVRPMYHSGKLVAFGANKAHHSDVGGKVPGSISTDAHTLYEEGLIIPPTYLMRHDEFDDQVLSFVTSNSRTAKERSGDLKAQVAANFAGERRVKEILGKYGTGAFAEAADRGFAYAEKMMTTRLSQIKNGSYSSEDYLEAPDGKDIVLKVKITISDGELEIDYTGTDRQVTNPINAVFGVTLSGVHYVLRTLVGSDVPANDGAFACVKVYAPSGTILNPTYPHPVAIGNLETSQRNADLIYRAFFKAAPDKIPAASGGSMNNVMMGGIHNGKSWAFYETIGVGLGAKIAMDGIDGIQCNMTNTLNTPIEEMERSLPVVLNRYEFREDSSGAGKFRGGCGLIRAFEMFGEASTVTVVSDRSRHPPWGLKQGKDGASTEVNLYRKQGSMKNRLPVKITVDLRRREIIEIRTAGGGGYGDPDMRDESKIRADLKNGTLSRKYVLQNYRKFRSKNTLAKRKKS
jgi:N-methylhydantoinase B